MGEKLKQDLLDFYRNTILKLMHEKNVVISQLARAVDIPQPTLYRLLKGKSNDIKLSVLIKIANFFSVSLTDLAKPNSNYVDDEKKLMVVRRVPICSWREINNISIKSETHEDYIYPSVSCSKKAFALKSKASFENIFSQDTILVVDPCIDTKDGDYVIVYFKNAIEATIRRIVLDGLTIELKKISGQGSDFLTEEIKIIGTILQSIVIHRKEMKL